MRADKGRQVTRHNRIRHEREGENRFAHRIKPVNLSLAEMQEWADKERDS